MQITIINCKTKLLAQGIDLENGDNGKLTNALLASLPSLDSWYYDTINDVLTINSIDNGTPIPDLSQFGEVVSNGSNS